jgi:hypothetical protein
MKGNRGEHLPEDSREDSMALLTAYQTGQTVTVYYWGAWHNGIVIEVSESKQPYKVMFMVNGVTTEEWFSEESIHSR